MENSNNPLNFNCAILASSIKTRGIKLTKRGLRTLGQGITNRLTKGGMF